MTNHLKVSHKWKRMTEADRATLILAFRDNISADRALAMIGEPIHRNTYYNLKALYNKGRGE